jgi:hypothetical protein
VNTPFASCAECRELIGGYVLDALDADEMTAVRVHLADCPGCAAEHASLAEIPVLLDLAGSTETAAEHPPAQLEEAVLDRFAREHATRPARRPRRSRLRTLAQPLRRPLPAALAGALASAAVAAAIALTVGGSGTAQPGAGEMFKASLTGAPVVPSATAVARLQTASSGTRVWLRVNGLKGRPEDLYQLWCVRDDGSKISAGTFRVDASGRADVRLTTAAAVGDYNRLSVERMARPPAQPGGQRVMTGEIQYGTF